MLVIFVSLDTEYKEINCRHAKLIKVENSTEVTQPEGALAIGYRSNETRWDDS